TSNAGRGTKWSRRSTDSGSLRSIDCEDRIQAGLSHSARTFASGARVRSLWGDLGESERLALIAPIERQTCVGHQLVGGEADLLLAGQDGREALSRCRAASAKCRRLRNS